MTIVGQRLSGGPFPFLVLPTALLINVGQVEGTRDKTGVLRADGHMWGTKVAFLPLEHRVFVVLRTHLVEGRNAYSRLGGGNDYAEIICPEVP